MSKKKYLFLFIVTFLFSVSVNEYNIYLIKKNGNATSDINSKSLTFNETVYSIDNEYYLSPVENFLNHNEWKRSPGVGNGDYFRRTPGYSMIYLCFVKMFGFPLGHFLLKYFQLLLFSLSTCLFFYITHFYFKKKNIAFILTGIYGIIPFFSIWTFYTITEAVTPALMVTYIFVTLNAYRSNDDLKKISYYIGSSFLITFLMLTRPYTAIGGIVLLVYFISDYGYLWKGNIKKLMNNLLLIALFPLMMIGAWAVRNYKLTSEIVILEKAFHPQSLDRMKPEFEGMLNFSKCWGEDGAFFNTYHQPMFTAAITGDTSDIYIKNVLDEWPKEIVTEFGYRRLYAIVKQHQSVLFMQKVYYDQQLAMPNYYLPEQVAINQQYNKLIKEYKLHHFFSYWLKTPITYLKRMVFHSNTAHIFLFQIENRDVVLFNIIRLLMLIVHILLYVALFFNLFVLRRSIHKITLIYLPILFICFFTIFHREIEQRYMLPILPVIIIGLGFTINEIFENTYVKSIHKKIARKP